MFQNFKMKISLKLCVEALEKKVQCSCGKIVDGSKPETGVILPEYDGIVLFSAECNECLSNIPGGN